MSAIDVTPAPTPREMGQQLRSVREASGLTVERVASELRMQKSLIHALEAGDWDRLGAMVFVRGHLRSYTRLLKIELNGLDDITRAAPAPVTPMVRASRGRQVFGRLGTQLVYVVITVLIGVPVWMAAQRHLATPDKPLALALDVPDVTPPAPPSIVDEAGADAPEAADTAVVAVPDPTPPRPLTPTVASLLPSAAPPAAEISLHFTQDSWVELYAPNGHAIEQHLIAAGEVRTFQRGQLGRVVIGNADGVSFKIGGKVQDLDPWRRANVARFAVSSDGSLGPARD